MKNFNVKRSAFHAIEDGTSETKVISVLFDAERLVFSIALPKYVATHLSNFVTATIDVNSINNGVIESEQCRSVIEIYERACEAYCNWRLTMSGPTRLWIGGMGEPSDFTAQVFGVNSMAALGYTPVKASKKNDGSIAMVEVMADGDFGRFVGAAGMKGDPVLVDDTPEMRAKLDRLIKSVGVAGTVIKGIALAEDPAKYIMEIAEDDPVVKSEPAGIPLTPDAPETTPVVNPDDDF